MDLSLGGNSGKLMVGVERVEGKAPDAHMVRKLLLCFTPGNNFKSRFVKAGHEQVQNGKCILFVCKKKT